MATAAAPCELMGFELVTLRVPLVDGPLDDSVWAEVDETSLPIETRRRLAANGIRAGIFGARLPTKLDELLKPVESQAAEDGSTAIQVSDFENEQPVRRRVIQTRSGRKMKFICMGERTRVPELSLLMRSDDGSVRGRTYAHVMGLLLARAFPQGDGRVRLDIVPEVEHGEQQRRFVPGDGMMRVEFGPAHDQFDELEIEAELSPGQTLLLTSLPGREGTLGHHFFAEHSDRAMQKLFLVRLVTTNYDDRFSTAAPAAELD